MSEGGGSITSSWTWGTNAGAHEIGRLKSQQISGIGIATYSEAHTFDGLGHPIQTQYTENGNTYTVEQTYSTLTGFVDTLTYPTSTLSYRLKLQYDYQHGAQQAYEARNEAMVTESLSRAAESGEITPSQRTATRAAEFSNLADSYAAPLAEAFVGVLMVGSRGGGLSGVVGGLAIAGAGATYGTLGGDCPL